MKIPLDKDIENLRDTPYTISYIIRKRQQVDNFNELPKDKRPPELMVWDSGSDEIESWLERVMSGKESPTANFTISPKDIEG